jgi:hypothetical protein
LRREAFQSQLRCFLDDHQFDVATTTPTAAAVTTATTANKDNPDASNAKQRRRLRRRRHREHREQARLLIHQYSPAPPSSSAAAAPAIGDPISSRRSSAPSSLPTPQSIPLAAQQATSTSSTAQASHRRKHRHRRRRGGNHHSSDTYDDAPTLGDTIISTAVESAIRLKQSPIPDVLKTCFRASRVIFSKVDEKFHLQEKAWQLSKQSIEKAIELDEQYAIHEVVTETFFATVTGLVKAGIAYKETPSYGSLRAAAASAPLIEPKSAQSPALLMPSLVAAGTGGSGLPRSQNPQAILPKKSAPMLSFPWRRHSVIEEEKEETRNDGENQSDDEEDDDEEEDGAGEGYDSVDSSSSCFTTSEDGEDGDQVDESDSSSYPPSHRGGRHHRRRSNAASPCTDQVRQRLDMLMALRGVASYIVGAK